MIRIPAYRRLSQPHVLIAAVAALWLAVCARELALTMAYPSKIGICILLLCVAVPVAAIYVARIPIYLLCAYAILVPFSTVLPLSQAAAASSSTDTLAKLLGIVVGAALLLSLLVFERITLPSRSLLVVLGFGAYTALTACWAIDPSYALKTCQFYAGFVGLYLAVALYPATRRDVHAVAIATIAGAVASALFGIYEFWHKHGALGIHIARGVRIDPNEYATALLTPIAIGIVAFFGARGGNKAGWFVVLAMLFAGFFISGSRGGMIALAAMIAFLIVRSRYRWALLGTIPFLALALFVSPIGHRLLQPDVATGDSRAYIWKIGIAALHQYWLTGAGSGNFENAYAQFFLSVPHPALPWYRPAHNILIQSAVEYGIPGLLLMLAMWYEQFAEAGRARGGDAIGEFGIALQAGIIGIFVSGLSLGVLWTKYTWLAFSLIALYRAASLHATMDHRE